MDSDGFNVLNGPKKSKAHHISVKHIVVGDVPVHIAHSATLTLKDGDHPFDSVAVQMSTDAAAVKYKHSMQIHVDGDTLVSQDSQGQTWRHL